MLLPNLPVLLCSPGSAPVRGSIDPAGTCRDVPDGLSGRGVPARCARSSGVEHLIEMTPPE